MFEFGVIATTTATSNNNNNNNNKHVLLQYIKKLAEKIRSLYVCSRSKIWFT